MVLRLQEFLLGFLQALFFLEKYPAELRFKSPYSEEAFL